jgi:hypothetical protein
MQLYSSISGTHRVSALSQWVKSADLQRGHVSLSLIRRRLKKRFSRDCPMDTNPCQAIITEVAQESINWIQDPLNTRGSRSRTTLSIGHVFSINYGWDLPFDRWLFSSPGGAAKAILGGWSVNGITSLRTGFPLNIESGRDNFGSANPSGQRPNYVPGQDIRGGTDDYRTSVRHNYINRAAFTPHARPVWHLGA